MTDTKPPTEGAYVTPGAEFTRDTNYLSTRVTRDGAEGYPVEAGRYRLVVARACPWANRTVIVRRLLGLEDAISMGICGPTHDQRSWTFDLDPGGVDPVLGYERLQQAFFARAPDYPRGITVPALVDVPTKAVVTNNYPQIEFDLATEWAAFHTDLNPTSIVPRGPDLSGWLSRHGREELGGRPFGDGTPPGPPPPAERVPPDHGAHPEAG